MPDPIERKPVERKLTTLEMVEDVVAKAQEAHQKLRRERLAKLGEGKSARFRRRMERIALARQEYDVPRIRVVPKDEEMRKTLVHPVGNIALHETGSTEWPLDSFTERRLRDGDVFLEGHAETEARQQRRAAAPRPRPPGQTGPVGPSAPSRPAE